MLRGFLAGTPRHALPGHAGGTVGSRLLDTLQAKLSRPDRQSFLYIVSIYRFYIQRLRRCGWHVFTEEVAP